MSERPFTYDRDWEQIEAKLAECERKQNNHLTAITLLRNRGRLTKRQKQEATHHMRQFKGLEGAIATLRWVIGDPAADPLSGVKHDD